MVKLNQSINQSTKIAELRNHLTIVHTHTVLYGAFISPMELFMEMPTIPSMNQEKTHLNKIY